MSRFVILSFIIAIAFSNSLCNASTAPDLLPYESEAEDISGLGIRNSRKRRPLEFVQNSVARAELGNAISAPFSSTTAIAETTTTTYNDPYANSNYAGNNSGRPLRNSGHFPVNSGHFPVNYGLDHHSVSQDRMCCEACPAYNAQCQQVCIPCGGPASNTYRSNVPYGPALHPRDNLRHGGNYPSYHHTGGNHQSFMTRICCVDCPPGDIDCYSTCETEGCRPTAQCANAGDGVYAAFCQRECAIAKANIGGLAARLTFLPDPACRGVCAAGVQQLCQINGCRDHGCYIPGCAQRAAGMCL